MNIIVRLEFELAYYDSAVHRFNHYAKEKENSEFKPVKLCLKTDFVSYPALAEGLVNIVIDDF